MHMDIMHRYSDDCDMKCARAPQPIPPPAPLPSAHCPLHEDTPTTAHNIALHYGIKKPKMIGPVFQLRYLGLICPCLAAPEDEPARAALDSVASLPVRYHRKTHGSGSDDVGATMSSAISSMSGLFGGGGRGQGGGGSSASYLKESASLTVKDTLSGPAIFIETEPNASNTEDEEVRQDGTVVPIEPTVRRKTIPLKKVGRVVAVDGGFMGVGASTSMVAVMSRGKLHNNGVGEELCRFNVLDERGRKADGDDRERVVNKLMCLVEWNRRRMERAGVSDDGANDDDDEDDECKEVSGTGKKGVPHGRAAKAAYFAKREIELTKTRREREQRKARYLKESGGLKYTAIAMANNAGMT